MTQQDDYLVSAILCHKELAEQGEALALAQDTIRIALKTAGYESVDSMSQFERASALLDMAQEYNAMLNALGSRIDKSLAHNDTPTVAWANGRGYNRRATA